MAQPNGPSYEFFAPLLPPPRYVHADFRHYPIILCPPGEIPSQPVPFRRGGDPAAPTESPPGLRRQRSQPPGRQPELARRRRARPLPRRARRVPVRQPARPRHRTGTRGGLAAHPGDPLRASLPGAGRGHGAARSAQAPAPGRDLPARGVRRHHAGPGGPLRRVREVRSRPGHQRLPLRRGRRPAAEVRGRPPLRRDRTRAGGFRLRLETRTRPDGGPPPGRRRRHPRRADSAARSRPRPGGFPRRLCGGTRRLRRHLAGHRRAGPAGRGTRTAREPRLAQRARAELPAHQPRPAALQHGQPVRPDLRRRGQRRPHGPAELGLRRRDAAPAGAPLRLHPPGPRTPPGLLQGRQPGALCPDDTG
jgi:hypothetical protein